MMSPFVENRKNDVVNPCPSKRALVRIIKEFKEKKILEARGRKIKIINPDELAEMIEVY